MAHDGDFKDANIRSKDLKSKLVDAERLLASMKDERPQIGKSDVSLKESIRHANARLADPNLPVTEKKVLQNIAGIILLRSAFQQEARLVQVNFSLEHLSEFRLQTDS